MRNKPRPITVNTSSDLMRGRATTKAVGARSWYGFEGLIRTVEQYRDNSGGDDSRRAPGQRPP